MADGLLVEKVSKEKKIELVESEERGKFDWLLEVVLYYCDWLPEMEGKCEYIRSKEQLTIVCVK
ncbi:hypothetical protein NPIL_606221, partial [Nephila pilipes]